GDKTMEQKLRVVQDPRSQSTIENLRAQLAFYREVEKAAADLTDRLKTVSPGMQEKLKKQGAILSSLLIDLEAADGPPTGAQQLLYRETTESIRKVSSR
ncbi:MAG TPA: hypothetical protein VJ521_04550, partial [Acidobacteriota bacterium]|nr:hypothetical protein [Acidobacteriota bacterium]